MESHAANGPQALMQMFQGAQVTALLASGIELGVFGAIAQGAHTREAIAAAVHAPARSVGVLCDGLAVVGLLVKQGAAYDNAPLAAEHLVPGGPMYLGGITEIFASPIMWSGFSRLTEAVRNDGTVLAEHAETPQHPFWEAFARGSAAMAVPAAHALAGILGDWMGARPKLRVLDVACGSGLYGLTLARDPKVELTLLDWPNVLVETKKWAERLGADAARVRYLAGNLFELDYQGPYDLVVLSNVYHHFDDATCQSLTHKVAAALAPGGRIAINEFLYDESLSNPMAALFRMTMLLWTRKGTAYTESDYRRWLGAAGLPVVDVKPALGMPSTFVIGEKK